MYNKANTLLIIALSLFFSGSIIAQTAIQKNTTNSLSIPDHECGTVATPTEISYMRNLWQKNQATELTFLKNSKQTNKAPINIPIKAHIIRDNAGKGGLPVADLNAAIATMNGYYINANIQFYLCDGINYIDNSTYYNFNSNNEAALRANNDPNNINIYFMNSATSGTLSVCGYTRFPGPGSINNTIIMVNSCATNGSTLSHEMGHFFTLYHTHGKTNIGRTDELVNGSNCSTHGDDICDTPADPNLFAVVNNACIYTGTAVDANGQSYNPDPNNIMSYSRPACRTFFSPQQYARINSTAINSTFRNSYTCLSIANDAGIVDVLNPKNNSSFCNATLAPEVVLRNFSGSSLTSVKIKYQINSKPVNTYTWTGNLAAQKTTTVTLPSIAAPSNSAFTFKVYTKKPNGSTDNDLSNDELIIKTNNSVNVKVTLNNNTILALEASATYKWLDCNNNYAVIPGETSRQFTSSVAGNYAVEVTQNNCIDTSLCVTITAVNIIENSLKNQIYIYPNPNKGIVNIELGNLANVTIKVLNVTGQIVHAKEAINSKIYQFELNEATGVYFIEISTANDYQKFKLIKE